MVENWAFIYSSPGYNPEEHTTVIDNGRCKMTLVGVDVTSRDQSIEIAKKLVADGCQMIELCGGFGPLYVAKIKEATNYKVPVGTVMYGPEDRAATLEINRA